MKKRILIVDDEDHIRRIYRCFFDALGSSVFEIVETSNATDATNYIIRKSVDIVILDIKLPEVDGKYLFEIIKEYDPNLKIIIASVYPIDQQKRLIPVAVDYYDKSQGLTKLFAKVADLCLEKKQGKEIAIT